MAIEYGEPTKRYEEHAVCRKCRRENNENYPMIDANYIPPVNTDRIETARLDDDFGEKI